LWAIICPVLLLDFVSVFTEDGPPGPSRTKINLIFKISCGNSTNPLQSVRLLVEFRRYAVRKYPHQLHPHLLERSWICLYGLVHMPVNLATTRPPFCFRIPLPLLWWAHAALLVTVSSFLCNWSQFLSLSKARLMRKTSLYSSQVASWHIHFSEVFASFPCPCFSPSAFHSYLWTNLESISH